MQLASTASLFLSACCLGTMVRFSHLGPAQLCLLRRHGHFQRETGRLLNFSAGCSGPRPHFPCVLPVTQLPIYSCEAPGLSHKALGHGLLRQVRGAAPSDTTLDECRLLQRSASCSIKRALLWSGCMVMRRPPLWASLCSIATGTPSALVLIFLRQWVVNFNPRLFAALWQKGRGRHAVYSASCLATVQKDQDFCFWSRAKSTLLEYFSVAFQVAVLTLSLGGSFPFLLCNWIHYSTKGPGQPVSGRRLRVPCLSTCRLPSR